MKYIFKKECVKSILNMDGVMDHIGEKVLGANTLKELMELVNEGAEGVTLCAVSTEGVDGEEFTALPFIVQEDENSISKEKQFIVFVKDIQDMEDADHEVTRLVRSIANKISLEEDIFLQCLLCALGKSLKEQNMKSPVYHNLIAILDIIQKVIDKKSK